MFESSVNRITQGPVHGSTQTEAITRLQSAMDAMVWRFSHREPVLNALTDFFACRCPKPSQRQALGAGLQAALGGAPTFSIVTGMFDERFVFVRERSSVKIAVDDQCLAETPLSVADRLAGLLHGMRPVTATQPCAA